MVPFRRLLAVAGLVGFVQAGPATAVEWTLAADVAQRVEVDSNFQLDDKSEGVLFGSTSTIDLRLGARTKRTQWNLSTGVHLIKFVGPGNDSDLNSDLNGVDPQASGGVFHQGKRFTADAAFNFLRQSTAFTQFGLTQPPAGSVILPDNTVILPDNTVATLDGFGTISDGNATQHSFDLRSGITFNLDSLNRLSLSASGSMVRFSGDANEFEDATSFGTNISWAHDLNERTTTNLSFGVWNFTVDDFENTNSLNLTTTGGINTQLTPRLTFGFDAGISMTDIQQDPPGRDDTAVGFSGGLLVDYQLADTQFSLVASQGMEPSSLGEVQTRSTVGLSIGHSINSRSQLSLSTSYSRQVSADNSADNLNDTNSQLFALSPGYSIDLTPDWNAQMGYSFRVRDDDDGLATSHNISLTISRSFNLLQ